jgi:8-oxo-dGTP pyrophosphatase MutT (NUDIX family)
MPDAAAGGGGGPAFQLVRRALALRPARDVAGPADRAAVAMILRTEASGLALLFIRRAEHPGDPWSGQVAFPGGRSEAGDGTLLATAVRETREEIGLDLAADAEWLGRLDEVRAVARLRPLNLAITPFVFRLRREDAQARALHEVESVHWIPLGELRGPGRRGTMDYEHRGTPLVFPCIRYQGLTIWGLTFRMFESLESALLAAEDQGEP